MTLLSYDTMPTFRNVIKWTVRHAPGAVFDDSQPTHHEKPFHFKQVTFSVVADALRPAAQMKIPLSTANYGPTLLL